MRSGRDMARNVADAVAMIREAQARGAQFVTTPEMTNIIEPDRGRLVALARKESEDDSVAAFAALAKELGLWLNIGSLALKGEGEKLRNRSLLFTPDGAIAARYDKIHMFDVDLPTGETIRESRAFEGGSIACLADLPWMRLGLTICYDMRFAGLYRMLAQKGASLLTVPSAFTVPTGMAHWHVLLRARAIETGSFVLAAAQGGRHDSRRETYGHSLAVGPWGEILAEGEVDPVVLMVDIDPRQSELARRRIPALSHDRPFSLLAGFA
ncbi:MAG: carbon-nitrogen hydrolase family protein [Rhizobiales bacterium]|nr:carbon-nitrogen hydrolase family protein [Hyphomicrobiales bacterium]MBI3672809.1 carbon-nitrogen hydrolase family protein [Hyphomicrobiales bacterium]